MKNKLRSRPRSSLPPGRLTKTDNTALRYNRTAQLRVELDCTRSTLQGIIEELEASNEEIKSANEEIQSAKEELQSTNEELSTVNDELQHTNQQANLEINDLINLLARVQIPVMKVDNNLILRRFTPPARRFFNLIPTDIGRSLNDIKVNVNGEDLEQRIHGVIETLHLHEAIDLIGPTAWDESLKRAKG